MRNRLGEELRERRIEIQECRGKVRELRDRNADLERKNVELKGRVEGLTHSALKAKKKVSGVNVCGGDGHRADDARWGRLVLCVEAVDGAEKSEHQRKVYRNSEA